MSETQDVLGSGKLLKERGVHAKQERLLRKGSEGARTVVSISLTRARDSTNSVEWGNSCVLDSRSITIEDLAYQIRENDVHPLFNSFQLFKYLKF